MKKFNPEKCYITDAKLVDVSTGDFDYIEYNVNFDNKEFFFRFSDYHNNSDYVERNKHILKGLLLNEKLQSNTKKNNPKHPLFSYDNQKLEEIIKTALIPRTPKEKADFILIEMHKMQSFEGDVIDSQLNKHGNNKHFQFYFKNHDEYWFYIKSLKQMHYIDFKDASNSQGSDGIIFKFTYSGLEKVISLQNEGKNSNNCFVAMAFDDSIKDVRENIREAIKKTGFNPIIIDELYIDSDKTINDEIFSGIKKSRFCIADFSLHRNGVYFEAGFALGLGLPVIYTCSKDEFIKAHFDIKPLQQIIYKSPEELKKRLIDKIEAWIK